MTQNTVNEKDTQASPAPANAAAAAPREPKAEKAIKVTSSKTIDFPSLGWGIHAGETRDLPVEEEAQKTILSSPFISEIK